MCLVIDNQHATSLAAMGAFFFDWLVDWRGLIICFQMFDHTVPNLADRCPVI